MSDHSRDLLQVAHELLDRENAGTAHYCRSVSTAYYAIFQHLLDAASSLFLSDDLSILTRAREHIARSVDHKILVKRCGSAQDQTLGFPKEIAIFANTLHKAQDMRINADYGEQGRPDKDNALTIVGAVQNAMDRFDMVDEKHQRAFLIWALLPQRDKGGALK